MSPPFLFPRLNAGWTAAGQGGGDQSLSPHLELKPGGGGMPESSKAATERPLACLLGQMRLAPPEKWRPTWRHLSGHKIMAQGPLTAITHPENT